jgi:hypothetical protein
VSEPAHDVRPAEDGPHDESVSGDDELDLDALEDELDTTFGVDPAPPALPPSVAASVAAAGPAERAAARSGSLDALTPGPGPELGASARLRLNGSFSTLSRLSSSGFDAESTAMITRALVAPEEAELRAQIERTWALLDHLEREEGMYTDPLENRLAAAESLLRQGQLGPAEFLVEEIGVLAAAMAKAGALRPGKDPLEGKIAGIVTATFQQLIEGDLFGAAVNDKAGRVVAQVLEDTVSGPTFKAAVSRLMEKRLEAQLEEAAFQQAVRAQLDLRLAAHLSSEGFREAASAAVVTRPRPLLDRPEVTARIDAIARGLDRDLLDSSALRERLDAAVRARTEGLADELAARVAQDLTAATATRVLAELPLDDLVRAKVDDALPRAFDGPAASAAIDARAKAWAASLVSSQPFQEGLDSRVRRLIDEMLHGDLFLTELDMRTRELMKTPEFRLRLETWLRGSSVVTEVLEERLDRSDALGRKLEAGIEAALAGKAGVARGALHDVLDDGEFLAKVDEVARKRTETLVEAAGFRAAVDARVRALTAELSEKLAREVDQRMSAAAGDLAQAAADKALEAPALRARAEAAAARALEPLARDLTAKVHALDDGQAALERRVEVLVKTALAEGSPAEARLRHMAEEAAKNAVDEGWLRRVIQREITNREALSAAKLSGGDGIEDPTTALLRSDTVKKIVAEHIAALRKERKDRQASGEAPRPDAAVRSKRTTERVNRSELDTSVEPPPPRRAPPPTPQKRPPPSGAGPTGFPPGDPRRPAPPPR